MSLLTGSGAGVLRFLQPLLRGAFEATGHSRATARGHRRFGGGLLPGAEASLSLTLCAPAITWLSWTKRGGLEKNPPSSAQGECVLLAVLRRLWCRLAAAGRGCCDPKSTSSHQRERSPCRWGHGYRSCCFTPCRGASKTALCDRSAPFGSPLAPSACVCLVTRCQPARASLQELQTPVFHMLAPPAYLGPRQTANCCADVMFQAGMRL